eukprot:GHRR01001246.1.p1 GENE.GHRR01001246.1~~GHRR01001246.1.p1  ORF type:complete len:391 (+),score=100.87 GHRR01001246.1:309-1481(+)
MALSLESALSMPVAEAGLGDDLLDLCPPDFLQFLADNDLTGPLPSIPDNNDLGDLANQLEQPCPGLAPVVPTAMAPCSSPSATDQSSTHLGMVQLSQISQPSRTSSSCSGVDATTGHGWPVTAPNSPATSHLAPSCSSNTSSGIPIHQQQQGTLAIAPSYQQSAVAPGQQQDNPLTKQQVAANKRKAPEVDWRSIEDPEERRKQRRLAKNRITAARSRERKKQQLSGMEERTSQLEQENSQLRVLLHSLAQENTSLKEKLASLTRGATTFNTGSSTAEPAVLKCLAIMHLVCLLLTVKVSLGLVVILCALVMQQFVMQAACIRAASLQSVFLPWFLTAAAEQQGEQCNSVAWQQSTQLLTRQLVPCGARFRQHRYSICTVVRWQGLPSAC